MNLDIYVRAYNNFRVSLNLLGGSDLAVCCLSVFQTSKFIILTCMARTTGGHRPITNPHFTI